MEKKKTIGQQIEEARLKQDQPIAPVEFIKEGQYKDFATDLEKCITHGRSLYSGDFFIEHRQQREWALDGLIQSFMKPRKTCPSPTYLQTAIMYHRKDEAIEHLWTLPSKAVSKRYLLYPLKLQTKEQKQILINLYEFHDGTLLNRAKKLSGELVKPIVMTVN